jgi:hypothetical protein
MQNDSFVTHVAERFADVQTLDLGAPFADINTPNNNKIAKKQLSNALQKLTQYNAKIFVYSQEFSSQTPFSLCEPFVSESARRLVLSPFCQAGRNRSQVLHVILQELFSTDPRVSIRPPHGVLCGLDPYQNKDGSWSLLDDCNSFLQSMENRNDEVMFNAAQKGFLECFGRLKTHRILEDNVFNMPSWDTIAIDDNHKSQQMRAACHNYFTLNYYQLLNSSITYIFIGFGDALHQFINRIMESNSHLKDFSNLVLVVLDYPDLIAYTHMDNIPNFSAAAYHRFYTLLKQHIKK